MEGVGGQFPTPEGLAIRVSLREVPALESQRNLKNGRVQL